MPILATFGDSWPAGAELLEHEQPYGYHLAQQLDREFYNYGRRATSIEHMLLKLTQFVNFKDRAGEVAVFFVTDINRAMYFDQIDHSPQELHAHDINDSERDSADAAKAYFKYIHSDHLALFRFSTTVLALQKICQEHNIDDYYFLGWSNINKNLCLAGIDWSKFYQEGTANIVQSVFGDPGKQEYEFYITDKMRPYFNPGGHPNELGHKMIAQELANWIKPKLA